MKILTYTTADTAPKGAQAVARIMLDDGTFHPVLVARATPAEAAAGAQAWWDAEVARERARVQPRRRKPSAAASTVQPPAEPDVGDVI